VLLISLDGFRADYLTRATTKTLDRLAAEGVRAESLIPVFPTLTFPNHYTIVTGLYAENHGIVGNNFFDPELNAAFSMTDSEAVTQSRWWGGEPIWSTAVKQGLVARTLFWPGSEAEIAGARPTEWVPYDGRITYEDRITQVIQWLDVPDEQRPHFVTLYFDEPDGTGHSFGPDSTKVPKMVQGMDRRLGRLITELEDRDLLDKIDVLVVSDHGMAQLSPERAAFLDDYVDPATAGVEHWSAVAALRPAADRVQEIAADLTETQHMSCALKEELPERLHFSNNARIAPIQCIADDGWSITTRPYLEANRDRFYGGTHGFDPENSSMHGIFIARGPHIAEGRTVASFENVEIYNLIAEILELDPVENDGDLDRVRDVLRD